MKFKIGDIIYETYDEHLRIVQVMDLNDKMYFNKILVETSWVAGIGKIIDVDIYYVERHYTLVDDIDTLKARLV